MKVHNINKNNSISEYTLPDCYFAEYYLYDDIALFYPEFNKGCVKRQILNKYKFLNTDYNYIVFKNNKYVFYTEKYNRAKLFFKKDCIDNLLKIEPLITRVAPELLKPELPEFLINGNYKVIIRGTFSEDDIYFSIPSLSKVFSVPDLNKYIKLHSETYVPEIDYVNFTMIVNKKHLTVPYFTFEGFIKYTYNAKNTKAKQIRTWCNKLVYSSMLGTSEQKAEVVTNQIIKTENDKKTLITKLGIDIKDFKKVVSTFGVYNCLYLLVLEEKDNSYVVKYGKSKNLYNRLEKHYKDFGKAYIKLCRYIDDSELTQAEADLKSYFVKNYKQLNTYSGKVRKEVFEINKNSLNDIKNTYDTLCQKYGNKVKDINDNFKSLERNILLEKKDLSSKTKVFEKDNLKNESALKLKIAELQGLINNKDKDIELLSVKLEMANYKLTSLQK